MSDRIEMDMAEMRTLGNNLQTIYDAFEKVGSDVKDWSELTGDKRLAKAVAGFFNAWTNKRKKMLTNIENMQKQVTGIVDTYEEIDSELFKGLQSPPTP